MEAKKTPQRLIQSYASATIAGLVGKVNASSSLEHGLTKGELRELFISEVLRPFLSRQFGIGTGVILNQEGDQSKQTDIIIFDENILPPFISQSHMGIYPAESVVATIEVKSTVDSRAIKAAELSAAQLHERIYDPNKDLYRLYDKIRPVCTIIGFRGRGPRELSSQNSGHQWLTDNVKHLIGLCVPGKYSWFHLDGKGWSKSEKIRNFEETKRFIAILLDNLRTLITTRNNHLSQFAHKDWVGLYIRERPIV